MLQAAKTNDIETIKKLIENNEDVNQVFGYHNETALFTACKHGYINLVNLLIDANANVNLVDYRGYTPLIEVCEKGHEEIVEILLKNNAKTESKDFSFSKTALNAATQKGHLSVVNLLIKYKADINASDNAGFTSLMIASRDNNYSIVETLLLKDANKDLVNNLGKTALDLALKKGHSKIVELIQKGPTKIKNEIIDRYIQNPNIENLLEAIEHTRTPTDEEKKETVQFVNEIENKPKNEKISDKQLNTYLLMKAVEKNGYEIILSKNKPSEDPTLKVHANLLFSGAFFYLNVYEFVFENDNISVEMLNKNQKLKEEFKEEFKNFIKNTLNDDSIYLKVLDIKSGSIKIIVNSDTRLDKIKIFEKKNNGPKGSKLKSIDCVTEFLKSILVNEEVFDETYNMDYTPKNLIGYKEKRGNEDYYFPYGWKRKGLNIKNYFYDSKSNFEWLGMSNTDKEWSVAFHGLSNDNGNNIKNNLNSIVNDESGKPKLKPGLRQLHKNDINVNERSTTKGEKCGEGVYCTPFVEIAEKFAGEVGHGENKYKIALQCRINPKKSRIPENEPRYRIVETEDIRPYGILVKTIKC